MQTDNKTLEEKETNEDTVAYKVRDLVIVDDMPYITNIIKRFTEKLGHRVVCFNDPVEAFEYIQKSEIDILVTDVKMPKMSGIDLIRKIREFNLELETILMTGFGSVEIIIDAIRAGTSDFILKPIDKEQYFHSVRKSLEKISLKEDLKMKTEQLSHSEKMASLGVLATGVAHEINNPNTFIRNNLELMGQFVSKLAEKLDNTDATDSITFIRKIVIEKFPALIADTIKGTARIENIVKDIARYSYHEENNFDSEVDISEVIANAIKLTKPRVDATKIDLVTKAETNTLVQGNFAKLEQVFINLIVNGADAIMEKYEKIQSLESQTKEIYKGKIEITASLTDKGVIVKFKDNGPGIPQEKIRKVFDPFFTTKKPGSGTGMGLYICYEIIKHHKGSIAVENTKEGGALFTMQLNSFNR